MLPTKLQSLLRHMQNQINEQLIKPLLSFLLIGCLALGLTACGESASGLTGSYVDDTMAVAEALITTISTPAEGPERANQQRDARDIDAQRSDHGSQRRPPNRTLFTRRSDSRKNLRGRNHEQPCDVLADWTSGCCLVFWYTEYIENDTPCHLMSLAIGRARHHYHIDTRIEPCHEKTCL